MTFDIYLFHLLNDPAGKYKILDYAGIFLASYLPYILALAAAIILLSERNWKLRFFNTALVALSILLSRGLFTIVIRYFWNRPRPFVSMPDITALIGKSSEASFPSGHATFFFALAFAILFIDKKWFKYFLTGAIVVGIARVFVGVHYPLDILGGALVGWLGAYLVSKLLPRMRNQDAHSENV